MSDRDRFVARGKERWNQLDRLLMSRPRTSQDWSKLSTLYRNVCADLSRARALELSDDVVRYLDSLASRSHTLLYGGRGRGSWRVLNMILHEAPRAVRDAWAFNLAAALLFYGPFVLGIIGCFVLPGFAEDVLSPGGVAMAEEMYSEVTVRGVQMDAQMAGYYVNNNVGIAFRCFATGAFAGLGSIFFLVYNGLVIGTTLGHLVRVGLGWNLLNFVSGHSAWELTGIVISGGAGLRLGWALLVTEGRSRVASVQAAGPQIFHLVLAVTVMLFIAAAVEGFWSASPVPAGMKYLFGIVQIVLVTVWLGLGGRGRA